MDTARASRLKFVGVSALVFATSATLTIHWCASMSAAGGMPMPGGWTMSMAWMRMPGEAWANAAASFLGTWIVMMVAMMLPSLFPVLWRFREDVDGTDATHKSRLVAVFAFGYFLVWMALGAGIFPVGVALTTIEMQRPAVARVVPATVGLVVLIAGTLQFTTWKAHHLACCRQRTGHARMLPLDARHAWRQGVRLGIHCTCCCAGLTAILLVLGIMDLWTMALVTAAMTIERFAPAADRVVRAIGVVMIGGGAMLIARAVWVAI